MKQSGPQPGGKVDLVSALEREKRQIGFELHDNICQTLAGTSMLLETIGRAVTAGKPVSPDAFRALGRVLETAIDQTRALSQRYSLIDLRGAGLMKALEELANDSSKTEFRCEKPVFINSRAQALAIFRIAQEAVKNALQHSRARKIRILLTQTKSAVLLKVKDDGKGFAATKSRNGAATGFSVMHLRAAAVGGELTVHTRKGLGTTITCKIPTD
jgi:signal transduction histidine kinase